MNAANYEYDFYLPRWFVVVPIAALVTLMLLALMARLIFLDIQAPEEVPAVPIKDLSYTETVIDTFKSIKPIEKPVSKPLPAAPPIDDLDRGELNIANTLVTAGYINEDPLAIDFSGMPVPQFLVSPAYPRRAISLGIEGYVDVRFDITEIGTTENVQVMLAVPENIFDRAAVSAVQRWRYQPRMVEGHAKRYPGMTRRIVFKMEE